MSANNISLTRRLSSNMSGADSQSSSKRKLIDYTKNRARCVGERRRKRNSMCSDFQTTIDRAASRANEEAEESTSISTAGSAELVVFYMRSRFRRAVDADDDLESQVDEIDDEDDIEYHADLVEEDIVSHVSESETPSEGAHFGYLPGAIRNVADPFASPRPLRATLKKTSEDGDESTRSLGSTADKDSSSVSYCSYSECSSQVTNTSSRENSSIRSLSWRSVRSAESLELGLLNHVLANKCGSFTDSSQSSVASSLLTNNNQESHEENKSLRSMCSRSATGRSLDSLASTLLRTPTGHSGGKPHVNPSLSGGYHIRSHHVHTPSSVKKSKYLRPFTPRDGDHDLSQRSARSAGSGRPGQQRNRTISLKDFFKKEEVKRFHPDTSKRSMKSFEQKPISQNKSKSSEMTPLRKRANSDATAPETPVTASMTSQTMSTPSGRSGLLRSFSFSDKGNSLLAELNQTLKRGLLCDLDDNDDFADDDASVANSEALVSLMDGLRYTSKSTRALDVSGAGSFDDSSSHLNASSVRCTSFLYKSHSDLNSSESETDSMEEITNATTESLRWTSKQVEKDSATADNIESIKAFSSSLENHGDLRSAVMRGRLRCVQGKRESRKPDDATQPKSLLKTETKSPVKSTALQAGFLIQPKALPLRRLPKGTLPFAQLDCRIVNA